MHQLVPKGQRQSLLYKITYAKKQFRNILEKVIRKVSQNLLTFRMKTNWTSTLFLI